MSDPARGTRARRPAPMLLVVLGGATLLAFAIVLGAAFGWSGLGFDLGPTTKTLPPPPPPSQYGTAREIGTRGDEPNAGELFHGTFPSDDQTQEREVGGLPARFSGYTTSVRSVTRVPARRFVDVYPGRYLRVRVAVFNRDTESQHVCSCDFSVWTRRAGMREADAVAAPTMSADTEMPSGTTRDGYVYLYVGNVPGPWFVVYDPDAHVPDPSSSARGVWRVPGATPVTPGGSRTTRSAPPTTRA